MSLIGKISLKEYNCFISGAVTDSTGILADIELIQPESGFLIRHKHQTLTESGFLIQKQTLRPISIFLFAGRMKEERVGASISEDESIIGTVNYFFFKLFPHFYFKNVRLSFYTRTCF
jgi:hypothetical protein